jgi:DNA-binding response OmpR family regulator
MVVRADGTPGSIQVLRALNPAVVLLDLDLPNDAGWETADALLEEQVCPPLVLLTARTGQFDIRTAIDAGAILCKSESPSRLLGIVDATLRARRTNCAEHNAIQRVLIRWLKPCNWSAPIIAPHRSRGINE